MSTESRTIIFLAKNPFGAGGSQGQIQPYLAGHTVGFVWPMILFLLKQKLRVILLSVQDGGNVTSTTAHLFPAMPDNARFRYATFASKSDEKVPNGFAELAIAEKILELSSEYGCPTSVLSVYAYPAVVGGVLASETCRDIRIAAFLRGSDVSRFFGGDHQNALSIYRTVLSKCAHVSAVSKSLADHAMELGINVDSILPSPALPVDDIMSHLSAGSYEARQRFLHLFGCRCGLDESLLDKPWIVSCGRAGSERPIQDVVDAMHDPMMQSRCHCIIARPAKQYHTTAIDHVSQIFVPPEGMASFLYAASALVHPTRRQQFYDARPHVVTQAAHFGCPVILPQSAVEDGGARESLSSTNLDTLVYDDSGLDASTRIANHCLSVLTDHVLDQQIRMANAASARRWSVSEIGGNVMSIIRDIHR